MKNAGVKERKHQIHCSMAKRFTAPDRRAASPARGGDERNPRINAARAFMDLNPLKFITVEATSPTASAGTSPPSLNANILLWF